MAELLNFKRVFFPNGKQCAFLLKSKADLECTWQELASISSVTVHTLMYWRKEKNSMSLVALKQICMKRGVKIPTEIIIKDPYWNVTNAARAGGKAVIQKYGVVGGNENNRKEKWDEWWEREGKHKGSKITRPLSFKKPRLSKELAEFVGILLGDGGISKYQVTVTLNSVTDKEYFKFVQKLIKTLFKVPVGSYSEVKSLARRIVISRSALVSYLLTLGLKEGNKVKQQVDIPEWIKRNRQYRMACLRGLIDTDGCIILHRYRSKGSVYYYKKIGFTSRSYPLIHSVCDILSNLEIKHRITRNGYDIRIEAKEDVHKYFQLIGTNNPKHLKRYRDTK